MRETGRSVSYPGELACMLLGNHDRGSHQSIDNLDHKDLHSQPPIEKTQSLRP